MPELVREQIGRMVDDLLGETRNRLNGIAGVEAVRDAGRVLATFTPEMTAAAAGLKAFLRTRMYSAAAVARLRDPSQRVVEGLFAAYHADARTLPARWHASLPAAEPDRARHIADFIAGMTDRFALREYERVVGRSPLPAGVDF